MIKSYLTFNLTGRSREEIELKLKERTAVYLQVKTEDVEDIVEMEMYVHGNDSDPKEIIFSADCRVKVKDQNDA